MAARVDAGGQAWEPSGRNEEWEGWEVCGPRRGLRGKPRRGLATAEERRRDSGEEEAVTGAALGGGLGWGGMGGRGRRPRRPPEQGKWDWKPEVSREGA